MLATHTEVTYHVMFCTELCPHGYVLLVKARIFLGKLVYTRTIWRVAAGRLPAYTMHYGTTHELTGFSCQYSTSNSFRRQRCARGLSSGLGSCVYAGRRRTAVGLLLDTLEQTALLNNTLVHWRARAQ